MKFPKSQRTFLCRGDANKKRFQGDTVNKNTNNTIALFIGFVTLFSYVICDKLKY